MSEQNTVECPAERLSALIADIQADAAQGLDAVFTALADYPADARLHFLQGSLLAGAQRYGEAHDAMRKAVEIAPGFEIARFQLGFLQLTSGDAGAAEETWRPLADLAQAHPLRLFSIGLNHLARDDFAQAIALLKEGIARNTENLPVNRDMGLLLQKAQEALDGPASGNEVTSATDLLLREFGDRTRH